MIGKQGVAELNGVKTFASFIDAASKTNPKATFLNSDGNRNGKGNNAQNGIDPTYFDGSVLGWIGHALGFIFLCSIPLIGLPFALCFMGDWIVSHTVIKGNRYEFTGRAVDLFGNWIKWCLLTIITLGIYGFWVPIKLLKWIVKNITYKNRF